MLNTIKQTITNSIHCKQQLLDNACVLTQIQKAAQSCIQCLQQGGKILLVGNGGSAADAQHIAAELIGRFQRERQALAAIALTTDTSILTAVGNDYGLNHIFSRQIAALGKPGDVLIALSTSGRSTNILQAIDTAARQDLTCIGLTGQNGGELAIRCQPCIKVPSAITSHIQECHIMIGHIICQLIDKAS